MRLIIITVILFPITCSFLLVSKRPTRDGEQTFERIEKVNAALETAADTRAGWSVRGSGVLQV